MELVYDPDVVSYNRLLDVFWELHDPTSLGRQGPDIGTQYRSAIFYNNSEQQKTALISKLKIGESGKYKKEIVTEIQPAGPFYRAEEYHQQYFEKKGMSGGCIMF